MPPLPRICNGEFCCNCCCWSGCACVVGLFAAGTTVNWSGSGGLTSDPSCIEVLCEEHAVDKTSEHWQVDLMKALCCSA